MSDGTEGRRDGGTVAAEEPTEPRPRFAPLPAELTPDLLEQEMLREWAREGLFDVTDEARRGRPEFVFYEGPPTANGRPGIHHVFARTIKDLFCRHRVMKGYHVTRKAGWDTHGLPVEIEVEKELGISGKQQIEALGVEEFNRRCRESVWRYKDEFEQLSARIGYALDYRDPYVTYSNEYVESVWWALATLYDRGLLYRGHKILPYCPRCGTALSSHEVAQGYEEVEDPSVFVALQLTDARAAERRRILVWTTTPWTLVSNTALAVNPEFDYLELRRKGERAGEGTLILAEARARAVLGEDYETRWEKVRDLPGGALVGMRYQRPLDWVEYPPGEHEIIVGETFVTSEDGTGVVHMSPAFGADDYAAGQRHGLAFVQPVDGRGQFPADMPVVGGKFFKAADPLIVEELKRRGVLWKAGTVVHDYPHCWRCDTPLIYYARESWFVRTTAIREAMIARNDRVDWHSPEIGEGRFGRWLKDNIDWAISRDRYWGTPLPIWVCDRDRAHVEAVGSYARLAERTGKSLGSDFDPHKPYVDRHEWACATCGGTMRRVPEVIDAWFDSGSMPFAQWHYPFEHRELTARHFPADFIAEGVDQTRGWFYSLLAIATGLGDALPNNDAATKPAPYRAVVVNDMLLDADGIKMSKTRGNTVDPWEVARRHGADATRLFLIASAQVWLPKRFDEEAVREQAGRFLLTLRNVYSGIFAQYASFGWEPSAEDPPPAERPAVDRWALSRLATVEREADELLEHYEATLAARKVMDFVVDDVSNWYVRLNRARFYETDGADNRAAFATLYELLVGACRLLAPFSPFMTDWIHRQLTGGSVHLAPYAREVTTPDFALERAMDQLRRLAKLGHASRDEARIKVRVPLPRLVCVVPDTHGPELDQLVPLLASELNVRRVEFASSEAEFVRLEAKPNFRQLGKRFGKRTPEVAKAIEKLPADALRALERGERVVIELDAEPGADAVEVTSEELTILRRAVGELVVSEEGGYVGALDATVTPELRREGTARELVSRIQRMRKEAGFAVSDRIVVRIVGPDEVYAIVMEHGDYIMSEILAVEVVLKGGPLEAPAFTQEIDLDGLPVTVTIKRTEQ